MFKNILKISLVLLVFCLLVVPVSAVTMVQYGDSYIQGGDYWSGPLDSDIASVAKEACKQKCIADADCKAATYVPPGIIGGSGTSAYCFLKNINGPILTATGDVLWIKQEDSVVSVSSSPAGALIHLNYVNTGYITPHTFRGPPGTKEILLVLAGYEVYRASCYTAPGATCSINAILTPNTSATGSMYVTSVPSGATVIIDGYSQGPAPVTVTDLSAGTHAVKMTMAGYADYEGAWSVNPGQTTQVTVTLTSSPSATATTGSGTGTIQVRSEPSGASVNLDGWDKGKTPINFQDISTGNHVLMLTLAGYSDWKKTVTVYPSQTATVDAEMGKSSAGGAGTGTLSVTTTPAGAQVLVDGVPIGNSPMKSSGLTAGSHTLLLKMDGYKDLSVPVTITAGQTTEYSTSLVPSAGTGMKTPGFVAILGILAIVISIGVWKKLRN